MTSISTNIHATAKSSEIHLKCASIHSFTTDFTPVALLILTCISISLSFLRLSLSHSFAMFINIVYISLSLSPLWSIQSFRLFLSHPRAFSIIPPPISLAMALSPFVRELYSRYTFFSYPASLRKASKFNFHHIENWQFSSIFLPFAIDPIHIKWDFIIISKTEKKCNFKNGSHFDPHSIKVVTQIKRLHSRDTSFNNGSKSLSRKSTS